MDSDSEDYDSYFYYMERTSYQDITKNHSSIVDVNEVIFSHLPYKCLRCYMQFWNDLDFDCQDNSVKEEDGSGRDIMLTSFLTVVCPNCNVYEEGSDGVTIYGRIFGDSNVFNYNSHDIDTLNYFHLLYDPYLSYDRSDNMKFTSNNLSTNVGKGQSSILTTNMNIIIFDTGHKRYAPNVVNNVIDLKGNTKKEISMIISHNDNDHCAGMEIVSRQLNITDITSISKSLINELSDYPSIKTIEHNFWTDYLLYPSRDVALDALNGINKNNSSICLLRTDNLDSTNGEYPIWIGIAGDRDYSDFMKQASNVEGFNNQFDILSLPHHGSKLSTPPGTKIAPSDIYVVQGTPTGRDSDKAAHLNVINIVIQMVESNGKAVRRSFPTIVFTRTLLTYKDILETFSEDSLRNISIILYNKPSDIKISMTPTPDTRIAQLLFDMEDLVWAFIADDDNVHEIPEESVLSWVFVQGEIGDGNYITNRDITFVNEKHIDTYKPFD